MIFKGFPGMTVTISRPRIGEKVRFQFDKDGLFETHHPFTIKRMLGKFPVVAEPLEGLGETVHFPAVAAEEPPAKKTLKCKKCDFSTTEGRGVLLAHYRKEHPLQEGD